MLVGKPTGVTEHMNKRSFIREDEKAVSPVIATILMVAITVVLAAVLYIMVIGLTPTTGTQAPTGNWGPAQATSSTTAEATFAGFSSDPAPTSLTIVLENSTNSGTYSFPNNNDGVILNKASGDDMGTISYKDYGTNQLVNQGDKLRFSDLGPGSTYTLIMLWSDGSTLHTTSFNTPA